MFPERPLGKVSIGPAFDPDRNDPLLIPTTGDACQAWTVPHFEQVIALARDGKAVVLQFHGVPDPLNPVVSTTPQLFLKFMRILDERDYNVIAMRDLARYMDPKPLPSDPMTTTRCPDEE